MGLAIWGFWGVRFPRAVAGVAGIEMNGVVPKWRDCVSLIDALVCAGDGCCGIVSCIEKAV